MEVDTGSPLVVSEGVSNGVSQAARPPMPATVYSFPLDQRPQAGTSLSVGIQVQGCEQAQLTSSRRCHRPQAVLIGNCTPDN